RDEVGDLGVIHVEADHLRRTPRRTAALRRAGRAVEDLEEAHEAGARAAARELLLLAADLAEVRARARAVFEEARLALHEVVDAHEVVAHRLDEAGRALRPLVGVGGLDHLVLVAGFALLVPSEVAARADDAVA